MAKVKKENTLLDKAISKGLELISEQIKRFLKAYFTEFKNNLRPTNLRLLKKKPKLFKFYVFFSITHFLVLITKTSNLVLACIVAPIAFFAYKSFIDIIRTYNFNKKHKAINKAFKGNAYVTKYEQNKELGTQTYNLVIKIPVSDILNQKSIVEHYLNRYIITFKATSLRSVVMTTSRSQLKTTENKLIKILDSLGISSALLEVKENDFEKLYYLDCDCDNNSKILNKTKEIAYKLKIDENDLSISIDVDKYVFSIRKNQDKIYYMADYLKEV